MPTREELLEAADHLEDEGTAESEQRARLRRVARWLREQAEQVPDVSVG